MKRIKIIFEACTDFETEQIIIMKHKKFSAADPSLLVQPAPDDAWNANGTAFTTCPDEVARRAYFAYVNEGAPEGRAVQHWLDAEAELIHERNLTRTHGFHHQT